MRKMRGNTTKKAMGMAMEGHDEKDNGMQWGNTTKKAMERQWGGHVIFVVLLGNNIHFFVFSYKILHKKFWNVQKRYYLCTKF